MSDPIDAFDDLKKRLTSLQHANETFLSKVETDIAEFRKGLSEALTALSNDIDNAALECMEQQEWDSSELEKLRAFKAAFEALRS